MNGDRMGCSSPPFSPFAPVKYFCKGGNRGNEGAARLDFDPEIYLKSFTIMDKYP